jgi:hypothetical protein
MEFSVSYTHHSGFKNPNTQITGNQPPQIVGFSSQNTQNFVSPKQPWQSKIFFSMITVFI